MRDLTQKNNTEKKTKPNLHHKTHSPQLTCREIFGFAALRVNETQCSLDCLFLKLKGAKANSLLLYCNNKEPPHSP